MARILRDWVRIVNGFFSSIRQFTQPEEGTSRWQLQMADQRLAWLMIVATIPVGLVGLKFEPEFRVLFGKPVRAAIFLVINGLIRLAGELCCRKASVRADQEIARERELVAAGGGRAVPGHASGHQAEREAEYSLAMESDRRLSVEGNGGVSVNGSAGPHPRPRRAASQPRGSCRTRGPIAGGQPGGASAGQCLIEPILGRWEDTLLSIRSTGSKHCAVLLLPGRVLWAAQRGVQRGGLTA